jgi:hypothetical protein
MAYKRAYRGTNHGALESKHYALYATLDLAVAERYGKVYALDLSACKIVSVDDLPRLLAEDYPEYAGFDPDSINLDADPMFGTSSECYQIASDLGIDGVVDHRGNIEIWASESVEVVE